MAHAEYYIADDDSDWLLCPRCGCGVTEVDVEELGRCTNCWFGFDDDGNRAIISLDIV